MQHRFILGPLVPVKLGSITARFVKLAEKMSESPRFSAWYPRRLYKGEVATRRREKFKIYPSVTEHYKRSTLNQMRRRLNDLVE